MIQIEEIQKKFGNIVAVNIQYLKINEGEIFGLVGNNGAGKTTLLRLILDLLKPECGQILSKAIPIYQSEHWKTYTGAYIDSNFLIDFLNPLEYFEFIAKIYNIPNDIMRNDLDKYNQFLNFNRFGSNKYIRQLSSGDRQKVGIIGALIPKPEILILDEPFNNLDPSSQIILKNILKSNFLDGTKLIIVSSHNLNHISEICSRIALMEKGTIIKDLPNVRSTMDEIEDYFLNQVKFTN